MTRLPLVAVTGRRFPAGRMFTLEPALAVPSAYCDAVTRAGGLPVTLAPQPLDASDAVGVVESVDALLLTGGPDVEPSLYGQEPDPAVYGVDVVQDSFEAALLGAALESAVPVLAICRGLQLVNVVFGGTLHQHITGREGLLTHGIPDGGGGTENRYSIEPDTVLRSVVGDSSCSGRCHHHQAVDQVGTGLRVTARCADGIVEGIELIDPGDRWLVAVQWHPEETAHEDGPNQRLFDALVARASQT